MGNALLIFGVTLAASYLGSVNPGPVNLAVFRTVLQHHRLAALGICLGCALPEIPGAYLALRGIQLFSERPDLFSTLKLAIAPVLVLIGVVALRKKAAQNPQNEATQTSWTQGFFKGVLLALLNPALIPFWMIVLVWFENYPALRVETRPEQAAFLAGAALGAVAIRLTYVFLTERYRERLLTLLHPRLLDQAFGWCFIGLGGWQAVQWWMETQA